MHFAGAFSCLLACLLAATTSTSDSAPLILFLRLSAGTIRNRPIQQAEDPLVSNWKLRLSLVSWQILAVTLKFKFYVITANKHNFKKLLDILFN